MPTRTGHLKPRPTPIACAEAAGVECAQQTPGVVNLLDALDIASRAATVYERRDQAAAFCYGLQSALVARLAQDRRITPASAVAVVDVLVRAIRSDIAAGHTRAVVPEDVEYAIDRAVTGQDRMLATAGVR